jgi:hypothetical protein
MDALNAQLQTMDSHMNEYTQARAPEVEPEDTASSVSNSKVEIFATVPAGVDDLPSFSISSCAVTIDDDLHTCLGSSEVCSWCAPGDMC